MTSVPPNTKPIIYPDYCHTLSPTIGKWCPLRAIDVYALKDVGMFCDERVLFHHGNHPIKWVRLTGVVVAVDDYTGKKVYTLDDSSGACIECVCVAPAPPPPTAGPTVPGHLNQIATLSRAIETSTTAKEKGKGDGGKEKKKEPSVEDPNVPWEEIDVGVVVKVKGRVGKNWMGVMQVEVIKVEVLGCTDMEVRCWNEVMAFRRDVLGRPWVVEKEDEEKCLRRRERELRHQRKEGKSKKTKKEGEGEKDEVRSKRKEPDRKERQDEEVKRQKQKEIQGEEETNRRFNARNKTNYPSLAVRRAATGKYDALGV